MTDDQMDFFDVKGVSVPVAVSIFPDEIDAAPRSWVERAYPRLIHYNQLDKGGHFAAWEQPELLVAADERRTAAEMRAFMDGMREPATEAAPRTCVKRSRRRVRQ